MSLHHKDGELVVVHRDIRPANVLLDGGAVSGLGCAEEPRQDILQQGLQKPLPMWTQI